MFHPNLTHQSAFQARDIALFSEVGSDRLRALLQCHSESGHKDQQMHHRECLGYAKAGHP